ncbi:MAG: cytochrome c oxidase assembly protein [Alphaproteobacteria bacterium]|nr:cytochrome c oxidase assembly protein [Alphaproteobacteria bacterium]
MADRRRNHRRNGLWAAALFAGVAGMVGLAYASVPLYRLFCQVTGFGGTTQVAALPAQASDRIVTVRFDSNVAKDLPWRFEPMVGSMQVRVGEEALAFYKARNLSDVAVRGSATYNVTPHKAGPFFAKVDCFCFQEQTLEPGEAVDMPVSFFVDPSLLKDPNGADLDEITLSYTFFRAPGQPETKRRADQSSPNIPRS